MADILVPFSDEQHAAATAEATRFGVTVNALLVKLLAPALDDIVRRYRDLAWQSRRRTLEANPDLAALVDAAREDER